MDVTSCTRKCFGGLAVGVVLTIPALVLAIASMGVGHGEYFCARILFPYSMWISVAEREIGPLAMAFSILQFPMYGWLYGRTQGFRQTLIVLFLIVASHALATVSLFALVRSL